MSDHTNYEELAALAGGGYLSGDELADLQRHIEACEQCKSAAAEFGELIHFGLPLAQSRLQRAFQMITCRPDPGATERFLRRASLEGISFSQGIKGRKRSRSLNLGFTAAVAGGLAAVVLAFLYGSNHSGGVRPQTGQQNSIQAQQQLGQLTQQNSVLVATLAEQRRETEGLRTQLSTRTGTANYSQQNYLQARAEAEQSASHSAESIEEANGQLKIQEKLLAETRAELARTKQAQASEQASLVADEIHIHELSEQLKTVKANAGSSQRQLLTAGGDVRNLMGARQLHVVDVRDTDPNGKPGKAFGRIFLTEGKSLVFYAFDLNDFAKNHSTQSFQVWGEQTGKASSLRSLGFLNVDNQAQGRWALKASDPAALKGINSIFVSVEPQHGAKTPGGQRLLFAYLGEPNHP